jgi:uncharacterized protein YhbP (UPF0306 family)
MTHNIEHALGLLQDNHYVVLATADAEGNPWATPVWFASDGIDRLYWVSGPGSRHSMLIEQRPEVALTVFDSTVASNEAAAFYATGTAALVPETDLANALGVFNQRSLAQGLGEFTREHVTGAARLRLYAAELTATWVLDQDADVDQRAVVRR